MQHEADQVELPDDLITSVTEAAAAVTVPPAPSPPPPPPPPPPPLGAEGKLKTSSGLHRISVFLESCSYCLNISIALRNSQITGHENRQRNKERI